MSREAVLQVRDLAIGYTRPRRPNLVIADGLNLTLRRGELVCLLGPNGVGKSTLLRTLAGMQPLLAGHVVLAGDDLHRISKSEVARRLSVVLTERPNVGLLTGYEVVALGRHPHTDWSGRLNAYDWAMVRWAVEAVGAGDIAEQPIPELSDGQRQKIMIARALAQDPTLMLLDEPTAFLDLPRRVEIMRLLKQLAHETGRAVLVSTHELDLALRTADTLWLLADGHLQTGTPEDLVLSDAIESTFHSEGVRFDKANGAFQVMGQVSRKVTLEGEGIPYIWTQRALERAGFSIALNGAKSPICITVTDPETGAVWQLATPERTTTHADIGGLLAALDALTHHDSRLAIISR